MADKVYNVLFLCTGNLARSIFTESILNRRGNGHFRAFSAGSHPNGAGNPFALALLKDMDYPTEGLRSKSWDEFSAPGSPHFDFTITVCDNAAGETCPVWLGKPTTAHWGYSRSRSGAGHRHPKKTAFAHAFKLMGTRINLFLSLPLSSIDQLRIKQEMDSIGKAPLDEAP